MCSNSMNKISRFYSYYFNSINTTVRSYTLVQHTVHYIRQEYGEKAVVRLSLNHALAIWSAELHLFQYAATLCFQNAYALSKPKEQEN